MASNSHPTQQTLGFRQKTVSYIINVLKQHSPFSDLTKIKDIALGFEEKTFTAATSQDDYMHKILTRLHSINKHSINHGSIAIQPSLMHNKALSVQAQSQPAIFLEHPIPIQEEKKQAIAVPMSNSLFEAKQLILQRKQFLQSPNTTFPAHSANLKLERGQVDEDTWREEIYQWLQTLKKLFLPELRQLCYKLDESLLQIASAPQPVTTAEIEKRYRTLNFLKQLVMLLEIARHKIEPQHKQHIAKLMKDLICFFKSKEDRRSMFSKLHKQLPLPNMNAFQQSSPHPHIQNHLQSLQLKQQGMTKSHLGDVQQQLATQKRQREIENIQNPSPRKKQKNLQTSTEKIGTSAGIEQGSGAGPAVDPSLQITSPGFSVSPLLDSTNNKDNNPSNCNPQESSVIERPIQRLLRVVNSLSPASLSASVEAIISAYHFPEMYPLPHSVLD